MHTLLKQSFRSLVATSALLGVLGALPAHAAPAEAPVLTICQECLWTYAEQYNFSDGDEIPQPWLDYAKSCCAACYKDNQVMGLLQETFAGRDGTACFQGAISAPEESYYE